MNKQIYISILVEGKTESIFIKSILNDYLAPKKIYFTPITTGAGGDIKFSRVKQEIKNELNKNKNNYLTLLIDYYGITEWVSYKESKNKNPYKKKVKYLEEETLKEIKKSFPKIYRLRERFFPYFSMHELEALLFSDPTILAREIGLKNSEEIDGILKFMENPEQINDSRETSPSHRIEQIAKKIYTKTITGIAIAKEIGIDKMRKECPLFNQWLTKIENLKPLV